MPHACWTLSDGRAGNARQAHALAAALAMRGCTARDVVAARRARRGAGSRRAAAGRARAFGDAFATRIADAARAGDRLRPPGRAGDAPAARARRARGADPRSAPRLRGTGTWSSRPSTTACAATTSSPCSAACIRSTTCGWRARAQRVRRASPHLPQPRTALLLGGPSAHARFDEATVRGACCDWLERWLRDEGGSLLATASRRTPRDAARARCANAWRQLPGVVWRGARRRRQSLRRPARLGRPHRLHRRLGQHAVAKPARRACRCSWPAPNASSGRPRRFLDACSRAAACARWTHDLDPSR